jgi:hypothetical protein
LEQSRNLFKLRTFVSNVLTLAASSDTTGSSQQT